MTMKEMLAKSSAYQIGSSEFHLELKTYVKEDGPIAIQVWGEFGPEVRLTINLPEFMDILEDNQIFVKHDQIKYARPHLEALGFVDTNKRVMYGNYSSVAEVWELPIVICDGNVNEILER